MDTRRSHGGERAPLTPMLVSALLLLAVLLAPSAWATAPPAKNARVVFDRGVGATSEGFLMNLDGSGLFSPTAATAGDDGSLALSPDGRRVAFSHDMEPGSGFIGDIFVANANGSGAVNLTNSPQHEVSPRFSPDGRLILFTRNIMAGNGDVFLMNSDGSNQVNLTSSPDVMDTGHDFSPDGRRILIDSDTTPGMGVNVDLFVMNLDGSGRVNLTPGSPDIDQGARFSPDGRSIAYNRRPNFDLADLLVMNADGSGKVNLTNTPAQDESSPVFSPDGKLIVFAFDNLGDYDLRVMNRNGTGQAPVPGAPGAADFPGDWEGIYRCAGRRATIVGDDGPDKIKGTKKPDTIVANGGKDTVLGRGGRDRICGGRGKDKLIGGGGRDRLLGGKGKDKEKQ